MMRYDANNFVLIMIHICDTFELSHKQMIALRQKVEKVYRGQPKPFAKRRTKTPVSLNALAITTGLLVAFGGGHEAVGAVLKVSRDKLIDLAREYDPNA